MSWYLLSLSDLSAVISTHAHADCEAGIKNIKSGLDELGKKVEMVEKANKQIDLSALSRISAQVSGTWTRARACTLTRKQTFSARSGHYMLKTKHAVVHYVYCSVRATALSVATSLL